jgi:hypothetical protein
LKEEVIVRPRPLDINNGGVSSIRGGDSACT